MQNMMALADDPDRLAQFAQRLQEVGKASGDDSIQQRKSLLELMHGLANYAAERKPEELDSVLNKMAGAAAQMSPDMLLTLITDPPPLPGGAGGPRMDLAGELQARLTDEMLTKFLVDNVVKDRGASSRLAAAFQTLVPDPAKQQDILAAAAAQAGALFKDDPQFESVWTSSSEMLMSYSDAKFVSEDYARELTTAQTQAVDVDKIGDDPPVRIRAWLSTVSDTDIRALDQQLILDLLRIEVPARRLGRRPGHRGREHRSARARRRSLRAVAAARSGGQRLEGRARAVPHRRCRGRDQAGGRSDGAPPRDVHAEGHGHGVRDREEDVHRRSARRWSSRCRTR
jgi:hypothetical protein